MGHDSKTLGHRTLSLRAKKQETYAVDFLHSCAPDHWKIQTTYHHLTDAGNINCFVNWLLLVRQEHFSATSVLVLSPVNHATIVDIGLIEFLNVAGTARTVYGSFAMIFLSQCARATADVWGFADHATTQRQFSEISLTVCLTADTTVNIIISHWKKRKTSPFFALRPDRPSGFGISLVGMRSENFIFRNCNFGICLRE